MPGALPHAVPYDARDADRGVAGGGALVFDGGRAPRILFYVVQGATALILFTGGNTSFNGFPFLASFVAQDAFLPRWLTKRGHRLVFSNGIIVLTVVSLVLLLAVGANVNNLVPFYAIGVFTGFSMAGFGMCKYHLRHKERGWRRRLVINFSAGVLTGFIVLIFAVTKFTEGAWLVVVVGPIGVFILIRLNREYRAEDQVLENIGERRAAGMAPRQPNYTRRTVFVFVDSMDLATLAALRYARSLRPTSLRAVHFVIDSAKAEGLRERWVRFGQDVPFEMIDTPDRRLVHASQELVQREAEQPGTQVTVVLPRRSFSAFLGRMLHDRTADKIAAAISRIPNAAATIIPFDVESRVRVLEERHAAGTRATGTDVDATREPPAPAGGRQSVTSAPPQRPADGAGPHPAPAPPPASVPSGASVPPGAPADTEAGKDAGGQAAGATDNAEVRPIGSLTEPVKATVEGRVISMAIRPVERNSVLAIEVADETGTLTALFYGRKHIPGVECGGRLRLSGTVGIRNGRPVMINPVYELLG